MLNSSPANPTLSVVIPARNEEGVIAVALASVAAQTIAGEEIEAIVVDNGSSDGTAAAVQSFTAVTGLTVRLVAHGPPGVAGAKNRGATVARGEILLFLDADSRMAPDLAARVVRRFAGGEQAASIRVIADSNDPLDRGFFELMEFGKVRFQIRAQMFYCGRALFQRFGGFDERLKVAEDREFLIRLQRAGIRVGHLRESEIATSPRRLHRLPGRLSMLTMLGRWALASGGIGRRWHY